MNKFFLYLFAIILVIISVNFVNAAICSGSPIEDCFVNSNYVMPFNQTFSLNDSNLNGSIIVNASNLLIDCNGSTLLGANISSSSAIFINGKTNINITNCTFKNYNKGIRTQSLAVANISVYNNKFIDNAYGLELVGSDNKIYNNNATCTVPGNVANGLRATSFTNINISSNVMRGCKIGIYLGTGTKGDVYNNIGSSEFYTIDLIDANYTRIYNNTIIWSGHNAIDINSYYVNITNNTIIAFDHNGIDCFEDYNKSWCGNLVISGNIISGNGSSGAGIYIASGANNLITSNLISNWNNSVAGNVFGIQIGGNFTFTYNNNVTFNTIKNITISNTSVLFSQYAYGIFDQSNNSYYYMNNISDIAICAHCFDVRLTTFDNDVTRIVTPTLINNIYPSGFANYILWRNTSINTVIKEQNSLLNITIYNDVGLTYSYFLFNNLFSDIVMQRTINNDDVNITIQNNLLAYPNNDLYNVTGNTVISSDFSSINITISNSNNFIIGDYDCNKHYKDSSIFYTCTSTTCSFTNTNCTFKSARVS